MFKPGQSGNPGGRSRVDREEREAFLAACPKARARLIELLGHKNPMVAHKAATTILAYGLGKPKESINLTSDNPTLVC
jgi:hypothetical protein